LAKPLFSFDAAHLPVSDIYVFWLVITAHINYILEDNNNVCDKECDGKNHAIVNHIFNKLFEGSQGDV
jgi:hypothetical protein